MNPIIGSILLLTAALLGWGAASFFQREIHRYGDSIWTYRFIFTGIFWFIVRALASILFGI
jgi:hypothetical protein